MLTIREVKQSDVSAITNIYNFYIETSPSTFEESILPEAEIAKRVKAVSEKYVWLVGVVEDEVIGYAYASQWKSRSAYRFTVETSIYLKQGAEGNGYGKALYGELLHQTEKMGYKCLIGGISLPNASSIKLHESLGFVKIGDFKKVGIKFGKWIDVGYWELRFEGPKG